MSLEARAYLVHHRNTLFQAESQREDLLDPNKTQTQLIALLLELINQGHIILFTAIRSDHHDDSALGEHCHANGYCADVWPMHSTNATDYLDADDDLFHAFLNDVARSAWLYQVGLAGSADTNANHVAAGPTCFSDDGGDHIHLGAV